MLAPTVNRPTTSTHTIPQAVVRIEPGKTCWVIRVLECPICGARAGTRYTHKHGGGPLSAPPTLGSRVSHCFNQLGQMYKLVPENEA